MRARVETELWDGGYRRGIGHLEIICCWPEMGLAEQGSGEELSRKQKAGVKGWGGSLCRLDTFPGLQPVPKVPSAAFVLWVHQQVQKPWPPAESRFGV